MKLIVLGLDAMNIKLVRAHQKEMPVMNKMLDEDAHGILESIFPPFTGPAWVSFQTGKDVGNHGLLNFYKYDENLKLSLASGTDVKVKTFYEYLDDYGNQSTPIWIPESWVESAREKGVQTEQVSRDKIFSLMEPYKPPTAKELAIERALNVLKEVMPIIDEDSLKRIRNRLANDASFAAAIRKAKLE